MNRKGISQLRLWRGRWTGGGRLGMGYRPWGWGGFTTADHFYPKKNTEGFSPENVLCLENAAHLISVSEQQFPSLMQFDFTTRCSQLYKQQPQIYTVTWKSLGIWLWDTVSGTNPLDTHSLDHLQLLWVYIGQFVNTKQPLISVWGIYPTFGKIAGTVCRLLGLFTACGQDLYRHGQITSRPL